MKTWINRFVLALVATGFLGAVNVAPANPVGDFFKRLGHSIDKATKPKPARRSPVRSEDKQSKTSEPAIIVTSPVENVAPPNQKNVLVAVAAAPSSKGEKRDVPYGLPVAGKAGFVTSPYAPDAGFIDVHSFPPGTEVKDPFTGKIFRTP